MNYGVDTLALSKPNIDLSRLVVIIPTYKPSDDLRVVVRSILAAGFKNVVVVDDGNGKPEEAFFESLQQMQGVTVLKHAVNFGKGRALKTAFNHILTSPEEFAGAITMDADGQHLVGDVINVAIALLEEKGKFVVLGCRKFEGNVPFRSRLGNSLTRYLFSLLVGRTLSDTQTGLRGLPTSLLPSLLKLPGDRYEYEMNMLISLKSFQYSIREVPIETVYIENNKSSHFNPLLDSFKIYFLLFRFCLSSVATALIDFVVFYLSTKVMATLASIFVARFTASLFNFSVNRFFVFHAEKKSELKSSLIKYYTLVAALGFVSFALIEMLDRYFGFAVMTSKIAAEGILFLVSFTLQRDFIFTPNENEASDET